MRNDLICVILTGGQSRRMGRDKAVLSLDGEAMSLRLAARFSAFAPVYFSVDRAGRFPVGEYGELVDHFAGQGPLNGIVSAFRDTDAQYALLMATDMPNASVAAAERLCGSIGEHDACLYGNEPLFALYRRRCLAVAEECLAAGQNAMRAFLERVDALRLAPEDDALFANLNTPEEWTRFLEKR